MTGYNSDNLDGLLTVYRKKFDALRAVNMLTAKEKHRNCTNKERELAICIDTNCTSSLTLPAISRGTVHDVRVPVVNIGAGKMRNISSQFHVKGEKKKYIFIMAGSANHFNESQASIRQLHQVVFPHLSNYSFVYYDLGLQEKQRQLLEKFGRAEVKRFPFSEFPRMRDIRCYTWKPLLLMAHIKQAEVVVWLDASIRVIQDLRPLLRNVTHTGIFVRENGRLFSLHTTTALFTYFGLGEQSCHFSVYQEIETGFIMMHNEPFVRHLILEPWVACALDPGCMCSESSRKMYGCPVGRIYGKCHRYDQSVLGYILIKLFRTQRKTVILKHAWSVYNISRRTDGKYLYDLQKLQH